MAAIDDYVVTPGGVVDVGGNPVTYDASGNINPTYTTDLSSNLSGLTSILGQFKGVFDRLKSGNTTTADVNAALGVLGLIMPSLTAPKTAGWKGSIDLNRQFTRTPTAPITYTPYSGQPVMGRQYFTSAYGAPGAPAPATPAPAPAPAAPGTGNPDLDNPSSTGGLAQGGVASLRRFAEGGDTKQPKVVLFGDSISSAVGYGKDTNKDTKYGTDVASILSKQLGVPVDLQAVGGATTKDALTSDYLPGGTYEKYLQEQKPDVVLLRFGAADAIRLNDPDQTLSNIQSMVDLAKSYGATPVLIGVSPFAPGNDIRAGNIVDWSIDPYLDSANKINSGLQQIAGQNQLPFVDMRSLEVPEGALLDGVHPTADFGKAMAEQIGQVVGTSLPQFQSTFKPIRTQQPAQQPAAEQPITDVLQTAFAQPAQVQQTQQPAALTGLAGSLPSGWSGYDASQKIDWYNQNKVTPDQLLGAGVGQGDIDWMKGQGYLGSYDTGMDIGTASLTPQSGFSWTGQGGIGADMYQASAPTMQIEQPTAKPFAQPSGVEQLMPQVQQPVQQPMQQLPSRPQFQMVQEEQVEAAQGGLMSFARGGRAMPPRYLRGQTDGMADRIPSNIDGVQPAKLSHGEFVIPADVVSHLGNGNSDAGAKVLYKMMDRVRQARTGTKKQGRQINPEKFTPGGIAGYAGGGAVAFNAGGAAPPTPTAPLGTSTETNISSWAGPYVGDMLSKTSALTNAPYQAWTGPLSAGYSPLQQKTFTGLESLSFPGQLGQSFTGTGAPTLPTASTTGPTQTVGGPTGIAANYMNPYLNAVLQPQLEEMRRQAQISQTGIGAKFAGAGGAGAFSAPGGARQTLAESELQRNLLGEMNKAIGTGYASAYDKALQQFNTEQGQARTLAEMMAGAGATQRGIEQEGITEARKQFETEQLKPYTDLRFQKEMLSGLPVATAATTANTSTIGDIRGGLADLQKALAALGVG